MKINGLGTKYDQIIKLSAPKIDAMFEKFIDAKIDLGCRPNSVRSSIAGPERFFIMNDCIWHKERIKLSMPKDTDIHGGDIAYTNKEVRMMLKASNHSLTKACIHFLASTGCRPAAITDPVLTVGALHPLDVKRRKCYGIEIYAGSQERYWSFLTPEATKAIDAYLAWRRDHREKIGPDSYLFRPLRYNTYEYLTTRAMEYHVKNAVRDAGIRRTKTGRRFDKSLMYGLRKRFATQLKLAPDIDGDIVEKLLGHKRGLNNSYLKPTQDESFREFVKAIPILEVGA